MEKQFLDQLQQEEAELSRKLDAIRGVIAVYAPNQPSGTKLAPASAVSRTLVDRAIKSVRGSDSYATDVRAIAAEVIRNSATWPVPTKVIVDELVRRDVEIRGQNALNAVSALLSRSSQFMANGRSGWTLVDMDQRYGLSPNETEAPNGDAVGAPVGGGATPSNHQPNPFA